MEKNFHRHQQDAVKKNISPLPIECGEKKFFTATSRMRWKKNISPLPVECGEKNFSPLPAECGEKKFFTAKLANLTNIHRADFNAYPISTGNIIVASDRWRTGLRSWWHAGGRGSNPCTAVSLCKNSGECGEKKIFTKNRKNSPHSTLKDAGALRWKKSFHR